LPKAILPDGREVTVLEMGRMDAILMSLGFLSGALMQDDVRAEFVQALKDGLRHDHIATLYQNLGVVIAEAGVDLKTAYDVGTIPRSDH